MKTLLTVMVLSLLLTAQATAEPYWISYEANDGLYPEEAGWDRAYYGPPADRWFEDGALVIDGSASIETADFYRMQMGGNLDPGPGEMFVAEWRLRIDSVSAPHVNPEDPSISILSDDAWDVLLVFGEGHVSSFYNEQERYEFTPHAWHVFELRSSDMRSYELRIDGVPAFSGAFTEVVSSSSVTWGDGGQGDASTSRWDYFRFGVIPEPATGAGLFVVAALFGRALR